MLIILLRDGIVFYSVTFCILFAAVVVRDSFLVHTNAHTLTRPGPLWVEPSMLCLFTQRGA